MGGYNIKGKIANTPHDRDFISQLCTPAMLLLLTSKDTEKQNGILQLDNLLKAGRERQVGGGGGGGVSANNEASAL